MVRNGIILIDFADEIRLENNFTVKEAAIHAAQRRMRPIFLTSSAAAVGVIPMIASRSSLWGPLGTVIAFGLMASMVLTLYVLPVLYWLFFRKEDEKNAHQDSSERKDISEESEANKNNTARSNKNNDSEEKNSEENEKE